MNSKNIPAENKRMKLFGEDLEVQSKMVEIIDYLSSYVDIQINKRDKFGKISIDLNTGFKSHAHISVVGDLLMVEMRYDKEETIPLNQSVKAIIMEIALLVKDCIGNLTPIELAEQKNGWVDIFKDLKMLNVSERIVLVVEWA